MLKVEIAGVAIDPDEIYDIDVGGMAHTMSERTEGDTQFLRNTGMRTVKTATIRRKVESDNIDAKALFDWFKNTPPKEVKITVSVPTNTGGQQVIYTITLTKASPVRWYFEHVNSSQGSPAMDLDCLEIAAEDIEVS